ncbi:ATP-binding protein [Frankia nepalensis]|nr:ATP-binding protein [Frankia nepalensis]
MRRAAKRRPTAETQDLLAAIAQSADDDGGFPAGITPGPPRAGESPVVSAAIRDVAERLKEQAEGERWRAHAQRRRFEEQLHEARRLESLGQLAGGVAHDFNNLLAVVINYASFVAEEVAAAAAEYDGARWKAVLADVEQIQRAADRATALTHQLLAFGQRETVQPTVLGLNEVVVDLEQLLLRAVGEHVRLRIRLAPDLAPVLADRGQLEQVLVNLAVNARDAMPRGGVLTIDTTNVDVDEEAAATRVGLTPGPHVRLRVGDSGVGIPEDLIGRVFEPFFTTKPKGEGSGLGLATVYGIIIQAGGHTEIASEQGVGTTVTCLLPATDEKAARVDTPVPVEDGGGRGGETILLVEDEDAMREVTRRILVRNGYRVLTAPGAAEAIALVASRQRAREPVDLLVTDVIMPGMQGRELANHIRALLPGIRVAYMSGYAHPVLTTQGRLDPGVVLLEKPFSERVLLATVRATLSTG